MTFDANRVRIELCDVMTFGAADGTLGHQQCAEVWLGDGEGRIRRTRKPAARLVAGDRSDVLRMLAEWIERNDDPSLELLARNITAARDGDG